METLVPAQVMAELDLHLPLQVHPFIMAAVVAELMVAILAVALLRLVQVEMVVAELVAIMPTELLELPILAAVEAAEVCLLALVNTQAQLVDLV